MMKRISTVTAGICVVFLLALTTFGCGDDGVGGTVTGSIQASPSMVAFSSVDIGESDEVTLRLRNTSESEKLSIFEIELVAGDDERIDELELVDVPSLPVEIEAGEEISLDVRYSPQANVAANRGDIRVRNSDPRYHEDALMVPVRTLGNEPELYAEPPLVRFQRRQVGQTAQETFRITNVGTGPLRIFEEPFYSGGNDFRIHVPDVAFPLDLQPFDTVAAEQSPDDYILDIEVEYTPLGDGADTGVIQLDANDVDDPSDDRQLHEFDVRADAEAACISVDSRTRNFGQVPIGEVSYDRVTLTNCGSETLEIDGVFLDDDNDVYELELGTWDQTGDGSIDNAVTLEPDESDAFDIRFVPVDEGTRRADVLITSNDPIQPELELDLVARGAEGSCPEAKAVASIRSSPMQPSSSITVAPLDYVVLDGGDSTDDDGEVVSWEWEILERPPGSFVEFSPTQGDNNDTDPSRREVRPLTAGTYRFGLNVVDDSGFQSCNQSEVVLTAIPDQNIHIELTWTNPTDPDETDGDGSDLDLHLTKMGPGEWYEPPYSIFFMYPNNDEESIWVPEDPTLDIDVRDGMGPENITMRTPQDCQWYAVGVHYYEKQHDTAYATVRIYINSNLRYERPYFPLEEKGQFWDVARIHWNDNDATILAVDGFYPIMPAAQEPAVTSDMAGGDPTLCTAENLY